MKFSKTEKAAVDLLRKLDQNQRKEFMDQLAARAQANAVTAKIARLKRVRTSPNHRVGQVYGLPKTTKAN